MAKKDEESSDLPGAFVPLPVPPAKVKGKHNADHYRCRISNVTRHAEYTISCGEKPLFNVKDMVGVIYDEAEFAGFDRKTLADARSDADKVKDAVEALMTAPMGMFETVDETLNALEREVVAAVKLTEQSFKDIAAQDQPEALARYQQGKDWINRIRRVRRLIAMAKCPELEQDQTGLCDEFVRDHLCRSPKWVMGASHVLRFMLWVGRSNMPGRSVFSVGLHHARMARSVWLTRNQKCVNSKAEPVPTMYKKMGTVLVAPPGHGKSELAYYMLALEVFNQPKTQAVYLHAKMDMAKSGLNYVQGMFTDATAQGRRARVLYSHVKLAKEGNTTQTMRVQLEEKLKSPTITASGVMAANLGSNVSFVLMDDIVPQSDVNEEAERKRRFDTLNGTWLTRRRGNVFVLIIGTFWHYDDALFKIMQKSRKAHDLFDVLIQSTGGPTTTPPFFPLWPEVYPAAELRARYKLMSNPSLWSANYQANPMADESRLIRKLRFFDPESVEHAEFVKASQLHLSLDPSATNREKSDKAGLVYAGLAEVKGADADGAEVWRNHLRVIDAQELSANQVELVENIVDYARHRPVYTVHVETRSAFHATADMLEAQFGIVAERHDPTNKSKEIRLKGVAALFDDSSKDFRAVVEFPGKVDDDGKVGPDAEKWGWLYDQFLNFGVTASDHVVDAAVQLATFFQRDGSLRVGSTQRVTDIVRNGPGPGQDPRIWAMTRGMFKDLGKEKPVEQEDQDWLCGN